MKSLTFSEDLVPLKRAGQCVKCFVWGGVCTLRIDSWSTFAVIAVVMVWALVSGILQLLFSHRLSRLVRVALSHLVRVGLLHLIWVGWSHLVRDGLHTWFASDIALDSSRPITLGSRQIITLSSSRIITLGSRLIISLTSGRHFVNSLFEIVYLQWLMIALVLSLFYNKMGCGWFTLKSRPWWYFRTRMNQNSDQIGTPRLPCWYRRLWRITFKTSWDS